VRHKPYLFLIAVVVVLAVQSATADAPPESLTGPQRACSLNGRWCVEKGAVRDVEQSGKVRVFKRGSAASAWFAPIHILGTPAVTNDGACVVDLVTGSQLIPLGKTPDDLAFAFYCRNGERRVLALNKFIVNFDALPLSTSNRVWAQSFGLDENDHLVVHTAEGRDFLIDPHDSTLLQGAYAH
jgi:hypothetical protein